MIEVSTAKSIVKSYREARSILIERCGQGYRIAGALDSWSRIHLCDGDVGCGYMSSSKDFRML